MNTQSLREAGRTGPCRESLWLGNSVERFSLCVVNCFAKKKMEVRTMRLLIPASID